MPLKLITPLAIVAVLLVGVLAAFVWDGSRADVIGKGVSIGPVDVGGLNRDEARTRLKNRLVEPLSKPLVIHAADQSFPLSAREARIRADVDAMVDEAVRRGREGGVLARTWRAISGSGVGARIVPEVEYARPAVQRLVDRARVSVSRKAQDAKVEFASGNVVVRPARTGRTIDAVKLRADVQKALVSDTGERSVRAPIKRIEPKVSGDKLAARYPIVLTVDRGSFRLSLFKKLKRVRTYPIAVGRAGQETPIGEYKIQNKAVNPAWHVPNSAWAGSLAGQVIPSGAPNNPIKSRWLGIYDGVGVHGTDARGSIGSNASQGCIRMLIEDVEKLYDEVPVGTTVFIH
ncbi:MAG: L,D-transpeptidase/peptidoglycan binding protein [Solirubrobacteraceae bacterium]|nr:L,D-transpeptidase/peptidoglycan binding protein [Solirubrobacteraceae bacterium]